MFLIGVLHKIIQGIIVRIRDLIDVLRFCKSFNMLLKRNLYKIMELYLKLKLRI